MKSVVTLVSALLLTTTAMSAAIPSNLTPSILVDTAAEPVAPGKYQPTWESLSQYQTPEWFKNAKFGIWAHWGPQCAPEAGDWYARHMYSQGHWQYNAHLEKYGHPSVFGFKDVINSWKAERWDPEKIVALYKRAGARYFFAMANHHDNLDLWNSKYHSWNSVRVGPKKDIIGGWAQAARNNNLPFGVSIHAAHAWSWYETAQGSDKTGPKAGVPYDGKLTKADGKGTWWEGLDPQELYAQNHAPSPNFENLGSIHGRWHWDNGVSTPDSAYCQAFYNRTIDLINTYKPDLVYFDDTALPLWPVTDAGLKITAHFYNSNPNAVLFGKVLSDDQRKAITWDVERGAPNKIETPYWQTDTCIGDWHYNRDVYNKKRYKSPATVVHMLADIVSKGGNLLLNVPIRGDGSLDEQELTVVEGITTWMDLSSEAIYDTRPFVTFGEGPASEGAPISAQGFNEGKGKPFSAADIRYTTKGNTLYAILLGAPQPNAATTLHALKLDNPLGKIQSIRLLGHEGEIPFTQTEEALTITLPPLTHSAQKIAPVLKIIPAPK